MSHQLQLEVDLQWLGNLPPLQHHNVQWHWGCSLSSIHASALKLQGFKEFWGSVVSMIFTAWLLAGWKDVHTWCLNRENVKGNQENKWILLFIELWKCQLTIYETKLYSHPNFGPASQHWLLLSTKSYSPFELWQLRALRIFICFLDNLQAGANRINLFSLMSKYTHSKRHWQGHF